MEVLGDLVMMRLCAGGCATAFLVIALGGCTSSPSLEGASPVWRSQDALQPGGVAENAEESLARGTYELEWVCSGQATVAVGVKGVPARGVTKCAETGHGRLEVELSGATVFQAELLDGESTTLDWQLLAGATQQP
jgi:hypothetical protein